MVAVLAAVETVDICVRIAVAPSRLVVTKLETLSGPASWMSSSTTVREPSTASPLFAGTARGATKGFPPHHSKDADGLFVFVR